MLKPGTYVRLAAAANGMPAGSEGFLIGWHHEDGSCLVRFWDGGPIRVPVDLLVKAHKRTYRNRRVADTKH